MQNVARLESNPKAVKTVHNRILTFLERMAKDSQQTAKAYKYDIEVFFNYMRGKSLSELTEQDLVFENDDLVQYQNYLTTIYYEEIDNGDNEPIKEPIGSTINRKISSVVSLFSFLARDLDCINMQKMKIDRLVEKHKSYGSLTWEETEQIIEVVKNQRDGNEKSIFIELAGRTGIRLNALMRACWNQIKRIDGVLVLSIYDKGQKLVEQAIPEDLYTRMLLLKRESNRIFSISESTMKRSFKQACKEIGIEEDRNITFHSLRKMGINFIIDTTKNVELAQEHANHADMNTTMKHYRERTKDFRKSTSLLIGKKPDLAVLEELSKEELLELVKSCSITLQAELITKATK